LWWRSLKSGDEGRLTWPLDEEIGAGKRRRSTDIPHWRAVFFFLGTKKIRLGLFWIIGRF
jgi:hypothetical protein